MVLTRSTSAGCPPPSGGRARSWPKPTLTHPWLSAKRRRKLASGADAELAIHVAEMHLDRLGSHEQRLRCLSVRRALSGELGHPPLAGGKRLDARQRHDPWSGPAGVELRTRPVAEGVGAAHGC